VGDGAVDDGGLLLGEQCNEALLGGDVAVNVSQPFI
jgi:hypothetical protein